MRKSVGAFSPTQLFEGQSQLDKDKMHFNMFRKTVNNNKTSPPFSKKSSGMNSKQESRLQTGSLNQICMDASNASDRLLEGE